MHFVLYKGYLMAIVLINLVKSSKNDEAINSNQNVNNSQTTRTISNQEINKILQMLRYRTGNCSTETQTLRNNDSIFCESTSDFLACYPSTPANTTFTFKCPYKTGTIVKNPLVYATRHCNSNGNWGMKNFKACFDNFNQASYCDLMYIIVDENNYEEYNPCKEDTFYKWMTWATLISFVITIVFVSIAIFIFLSIRSLRCVRNMIHCNMLFTFVFKCSVHIAYYTFILSNMDTSAVHKLNLNVCVVFNILLGYSFLTSFFWMMIEAVYLITVIVAAYSSNKIKLWWYLFIGWAFPIIPMIPYAILTHHSSNTTCSWISPEYQSDIELFIDVPIYILLAFNSILLIIILYVIVKKLRNHNDAVRTKYTQYKKITRATIVLFPLFGLTFAVFFYHPRDSKSLFSKIYYCVNIFLQSTQGVWVAFVYCFFNDEVKNAIKTKIRSWKVSHVGTSLYTFGSSTRHHSIPTLYSTQLTSNSSSIVRPRQENTNTNDPSRLPILQEDKI